MKKREVSEKKAVLRTKNELAKYIAVCTISALAGVAVLSAAVFGVHTVMVQKAQAQTDAEDDSDIVEVSADEILYEVDAGISQEDEFSCDLTDLQDEVKEVIKGVQEITGGDWSVYVTIPKTGDYMSINQTPMQAASVIKIYVMGAVYEQYDELKETYQGYYDVDELIESMITISDNVATDTLVNMLGRGSNEDGRAVVNEFCSKYGFTGTSMDRMMGDDNIYSDNYTTTEDCAKFLEMAYNGEFEHSKDMLNYLSAQTRTTKIPAGVPDNVRVANKTGELDDVQNDVAIVFTKYPYIVCVISDGVMDYESSVQGVVDISSTVYNYISEELAVETVDYESSAEVLVEVSPTVYGDVSEETAVAGR